MPQGFSTPPQISGERLEAIVESLDVIIWEFNAEDLSTTYISPQVVQLLGYTDAEAYANPHLWQEILHPDDREKVVRVCREYTKKGQSHELHYRVTTASGEVRWMRDIATYVTCENEPDRLRCVFSDDSEYCRTLAQLESSHERLAAAQRIARVGNWEWDLETDRIEWSDECYRLFGIAPGSMELTFAKIVELIPAEMVGMVNHALEHALAGGEPYALDQYLVMPDGEPRIVHIESEIIRDKNGEPCRMHGTIQDVTELRRSEGMQARMGRILDHSSSEVLMVDAETLRITRANRASRVNLGYTRDDLQQMTILDVLSCLSRDKFDEDVQAILEHARDVVRFDSHATRADGSRYPVSVQLLFSAVELKPIYVVILEDRSTREHVERLKDEFLGLVSHELRTPLTPLDGVLEVMRREVDPESQPRLRRMVELAHANSKRMLEVVNNLLDLRRLTSENGLELELDARDLRAVVADALRNSQAIFFNRNLSHSVDLPSESVCVAMDERRILQVLTNLLSNAAKFSEPGGLIEIELEHDDDWALIRVRDFGQGIDEEFQPYVFDRFTQAHPLMKRDYPGAGVGLALSKMLVDKHNGQISFDSVPGEGTTFCVRLPLRQ